MPKSDTEKHQSKTKSSSKKIKKSKHDKNKKSKSKSGHKNKNISHEQAIKNHFFEDIASSSDMEGEEYNPNLIKDAYYQDDELQ